MSATIHKPPRHGALTPASHFEELRAFMSPRLHEERTDKLPGGAVTESGGPWRRTCSTVSSGASIIAKSIITWMENAPFNLMSRAPPSGQNPPIEADCSQSPP